jgi:hypothetical protein
VGKWAKTLTNGSTMRVCGFDKSGQKVGKWTHFLSQSGQKFNQSSQNIPKLTVWPHLPKSKVGKN